MTSCGGSYGEPFDTLRVNSANRRADDEPRVTSTDHVMVSEANHLAEAPWSHAEILHCVQNDMVFMADDEPRVTSTDHVMVSEANHLAETPWSHAEILHCVQNDMAFMADDEPRAVSIDHVMVSEANHLAETRAALRRDSSLRSE